MELHDAVSSGTLQKEGNVQFVVCSFFRTSPDKWLLCSFASILTILYVQKFVRKMSWQQLFNAFSCLWFTHSLQLDLTRWEFPLKVMTKACDIVDTQKQHIFKIIVGRIGCWNVKTTLPCWGGRSPPALTKISVISNPPQNDCDLIWRTRQHLEISLSEVVSFILSISSLCCSCRNKQKVDDTIPSATINPTAQNLSFICSKEPPPPQCHNVFQKKN